MNTYDAAYDLAKAIKESDEMKRLTAAADKVKNDADAKKMVKEYIMAQMQAMPSLQGRRTMKRPISICRNWRSLSATTAMPRNISRHLFVGIRWLRICRRSSRMQWRRVWMYWN